MSSNFCSNCQKEVISPRRRSSYSSGEYCPHCWESKRIRCSRCGGTGRETSGVIDYDGSEREETRSCTLCDGSGSYERERIFNLRTQELEVYINGRNLEDIPSASVGW